ncbi:MAG: hypothetical protein QNK23_04145 [Crocinitomicaceae bacterium]|nr:hypothetical protein [Crocinitomicaceae bacterium]
MPGHGAIITGSDGQDDISLCIDNNNESSNYAVGTQSALNSTGGTVNSGDVVTVDWDERNGLEVTAVGSRAKGDVNSSGTRVTITSSGDTALSGTVDISSTHGENEGWAGTEGVYCANVDGEAAYLSE